jgi:TBC1 domain family protein 5
MYLKGHLNPAGGAALILKYTGRAPPQGPAPAPISAVTSTARPSTPTSLGLHLRQRTLGARSPLTAPGKFLQTPGGVEALFQGAAKGVIERGEKLGINQAVRDAVGEIRRNVQGFQEARTPGARSSSPRDPFVEDGNPFGVALLERRNIQLAALLDETMTDLRDLARSNLEGDDKEKYVEAIEMAAAKVQFVKVHLEDSSLSLPEEEMPAINTLAISSPTENRAPTVALDTTPVVITSSAVETARSTLSSPDSMVQDGPYPPPAPPKETTARRAPLPVVQETLLPETHPETEDPDRMDTDIPQPAPELQTIKPPPQPEIQEPPPPSAPATALKRPQPIPTRSSLAQSSFSWMLEPDTTSSSPTTTSSADQTIAHQPGHKKRPSSGRRNNKNAFLFGEVVPDGEEEEIFGLQSMGK